MRMADRHPEAPPTPADELLGSATEDITACRVQRRRSESEPKSKSSKKASSFSFWFYISVFVSILAILLPLFLPSLFHRHLDRISWLQTLPPVLRAHHSNGKLIELHSASSSSDNTQIFVFDTGKLDTSSETVLFLPGLGATSFSFRHVLPFLSVAFRAVSMDFPASGFSDPLPPHSQSAFPILAPLLDAVTEIREKGLFWAFDQIVETGDIPYDEIRGRNSGKKPSSPSHSSPYGSVEMADVIAQVVDSLNLGPFHLVVHDSALPTAARFISTRPSVVKSMTLLDSSGAMPAFPFWIFGLPVVGEIMMRWKVAFSGLMSVCCAREMDPETTEAHRILLERGGRRTLVEAGKALDYSFDIREWRESEQVKSLPLQVMWSNAWSDRWIDEGKSVDLSVSPMKFGFHFGGRWPQEDASEEISAKIVEFIASLES